MFSPGWGAIQQGPRTNTLAYFDPPSVTMIKSFQLFKPGEIFINIFTNLTYVILN